MNAVWAILLVFVCDVGFLAEGQASYAIPYNYGHVMTRQPYYHSPVQYGVQQQASRPPTRRTYYPAQQQQQQRPVYAPLKTAIQPRVYSPIQRAYTPLQPKTYAPVPRAYAPAKPMQPHMLVPVHPRPYTTALTQPRYQMAHQTAYRPLAAPSNPYLQRSPLYMPKPQVGYYVKQPMRNALVQQPIRTAQRPQTRTFTPSGLRYRNVAYSAPYSRGYVAASRLSPHPAIMTYGRNHIPKNPGASPKSSVANPKTVVATRRISNRNRNPYIIDSGKSKAQLRVTGTATKKSETLPNSPENRPTNQLSYVPAIQHSKRNQIINGVRPLDGPRLIARNQISGITMPDQSVLATHASIQPMKPSLDAHSNPKLSAFLKHTKKLSDAFKGDSMKQDLTFYDDDVSNKTRHRPTGFASPTRKLGSQGGPGGSQVTFRPAEKPAPFAETSAVQHRDQRTKINKATGTTSENNNKPTTNTTGGTPLKKITADPRVNLGLLKEKVLHSNNTQFLKRVLQVLRKYTKLMKNHMGNKTKTSELNNSQNLINNTRKASTNNKNTSATMSGKAAKENTLLDSDNISQAIVDHPSSFTKALNSTKTAIQIFDILNSESKNNSKNTAANESSPFPQRNGTNIIGSEETKDENASKKELIETGKSTRKPMFDLNRLKYGLERGNIV